MTEPKGPRPSVMAKIAYGVGTLVALALSTLIAVCVALVLAGLAVATWRWAF